MTIFRSEPAAKWLGKAIVIAGWVIFAAALVSEGELEARVGSGSAYKNRGTDRPDEIEFHGGHYYVNEIDFWRHALVVYIMAAGAVVILAGSKVRDA
jgi:hypothetical protein